MNSEELLEVYIKNQKNNHGLIQPDTVSEEVLLPQEVEEMPGIWVFSPEAIKYRKRSDAELDMIRAELSSKPLTKPDPSISRMPGEQKQGAIGISTPYRGPKKKKLISRKFPEEDYEAYGDKAGWLLHPLCFTESEINGRWLFWEESRNNGRVIKDAWRKLDFRSQHTSVINMLDNCIEQIEPNFAKTENKWGAIHYFFDWLLWSLGHPCVPDFPQTKDYLKGATTTFRRTAHDRLLQTISLPLLALYPADYFGMILENYSDKNESYQFSLSITEAQQWCEKRFKSQGSSSISGDELFFDPKVESGRLLLAASNYTTKVFGFTENTWSAKAALINLYLYAPHLLYCKDRHDVSNHDWGRVCAIGDKIRELKKSHKPNYRQAEKQLFSPLILIEDTLPPADEFSQAALAFGGSTTALPPADEFSQAALAFGSSTTDLPPADEFSQAALAFGGSTTALPPADEFSQAALAFGGSTTVLPPADEFSQAINIPNIEPEVLPTRRLLGGDRNGE